METIRAMRDLKQASLKLVTEYIQFCSPFQARKKH
jgi:hypothetical protein